MTFILFLKILAFFSVCYVLYVIIKLTQRPKECNGSCKKIGVCTCDYNGDKWDN